MRGAAALLIASLFAPIAAGQPERLSATIVASAPQPVAPLAIGASEAYERPVALIPEGEGLVALTWRDSLTTGGAPALRFTAIDADGAVHAEAAHEFRAARAFLAAAFGGAAMVVSRRDGGFTAAIVQENGTVTASRDIAAKETGDGAALACNDSRCLLTWQEAAGRIGVILDRSANISADRLALPTFGLYCLAQADPDGFLLVGLESGVIGGFAAARVDAASGEVTFHKALGMSSGTVAVAFDGDDYAVFRSQEQALSAVRVGRDGTIGSPIDLGLASDVFAGSVAFGAGEYLVTTFADDVAAIRVSRDLQRLDPIPLPISNGAGIRIAGHSVAAWNGRRFGVMWNDFSSRELPSVAVRATTVEPWLQTNGVAFVSVGVNSQTHPAAAASAHGQLFAWIEIAEPGGQLRDRPRPRV